MALIDSGQLDTLADDIVQDAPVGATPEQIAARDVAVTTVRSMTEKIMQYIVDKIEIKGVKVALDAGTRTIETYAAGVGSNGGALTGAAPVVGSVKDAKDDKGTQNNDGTGLVL